MSDVNQQTITPEFRAWLDREIQRLSELRDRFIVSMNMELGRKNGAIEALTTIRDAAKVEPLPVPSVFSENGQESVEG